MTSRESRLPVVDALKAIAAQLIVAHHLLAYGPLSDALHAAAPSLAGALYHYSRMAVQVFLVTAGYLATRGLWSAAGASWPSLVLRRYLRLVFPYAAALLVAAVAAAIARQWLQDDAVPGPSSWPQWLAHLVLLHDILDHEALSAGVWYIAIDFQLFALLALLLVPARHEALSPAGGRRLAKVLVIGLMVASLFVFNRDAELDEWAIYFFGAYALGACAFWGSRSSRSRLAIAAIAGVGAAALWWDFRGRIVVALTTALLLGLAGASRLPLPQRIDALLAQLSRISYALFLVHFAVLLVVNAVFARSGASGMPTVSVALLVAWVASLGAAVLFHRWVEQPCARLWLAGRGAGASSVAARAP